MFASDPVELQIEQPQLTEPSTPSPSSTRYREWESVLVRVLSLHVIIRHPAAQREIR